MRQGNCDQRWAGLIVADALSTGFRPIRLQQFRCCCGQKKCIDANGDKPGAGIVVLLDDFLIAAENATAFPGGPDFLQAGFNHADNMRVIGLAEMTIGRG